LVDFNSCGDDLLWSNLSTDELLFAAVWIPVPTSKPVAAVDLDTGIFIFKVAVPVALVIEGIAGEVRSMAG
jgi:hypothetical protein